MGCSCYLACSQQQLNDIVTQMNCLPIELMGKLNTIEKNKVDLSPLQRSVDSLRSHINKLVTAVERIKIEMPETPELEWIAVPERKKGRIEKVHFRAVEARRSE